MKTKRQVPDTKTMMVAAVVSALGATFAFFDSAPGLEQFELRVCLRGLSDCLSIRYGAPVLEHGQPLPAAVPSQQGTTGDMFRATEQCPRTL